MKSTQVRVSVSSAAGNTFEASQLYLNPAVGSEKNSLEEIWRPKKKESEYVQVDLGRIQPISQVETRGYGFEWVQSYNISHSVNAKDFLFITDYDGSRKLFEGNHDAENSVTNTFGPYPARYVRLYPVDFHERPTLKWKISYTGSQI